MLFWQLCSLDDHDIDDVQACVSKIQTSFIALAEKRVRRMKLRHFFAGTFLMRKLICCIGPTLLVLTMEVSRNWQLTVHDRRCNPSLKLHA